MKIAILPGDGIGPEIIDQAVKVLNALGQPFEMETAPVGGAGYAAHGHPLPEATLSNFSLEHWKDGELTFKLISSSANFKPETQSWSITNAQVRVFKDSTEHVYFKQKLDTVLEVRPEDFGLRSEIVATMNWSELNAFIDDQKLSGSGNVAKFELERENRTATPFSILVLTVIGVSIASRKSRGGIGFHLALAIIIGFIFIFISRITAVSAMNLGVPSELAVWIPNLLFGILAFILFKKAQK